MTKRAAMMLLMLGTLLLPLASQGWAWAGAAGQSALDLAPQAVSVGNQAFLPFVAKNTPPPPPPPATDCPLGVWVSRTAVDVLRDYGSYAHTNDIDQAAAYFPQLEGTGTLRTFRCASLACMEEMADEAIARGIPFDAFGYDLEGWDQTPEWERTHQVEATQRARELADRYGVQLVMGPARAFTWRNWPAMAPYADMWIIQAQAGQRNYPAGSAFYDWLEEYVDMLDTNPDMPIWAQLSTSPDAPLDMDGYMAYVHSVWPSLVDGVYVFNPGSTLQLLPIWQHCCDE